MELSRTRHTNKLGGPLRSSSPSSSSSGGSSSDDSSSASLPEPTAAARSHDVSSTTHSNSLEFESRHSGGYERPRAIAGARRSELDMQKDMQRISELLEATAMPPLIDVQPPTEGGGGSLMTRQPWGANSSMRVVPTRSRTSNSSTLTSLRDEPDQLQASPSMESSDWRNFIRSESQNSVPSWASSISLDCRAGEEPVKEFMKHFTQLLFSNSAAVNLELKSELGVLLRLEMGRLWFTRFLSEQRNKSKRLETLTFNALAQYFALALFECGECEDHAPAAVLMNLCFLFYHEGELRELLQLESVYGVSSSRALSTNARIFILNSCSPLQLKFLAVILIASICSYRCASSRCGSSRASGTPSSRMPCRLSVSIGSARSCAASSAVRQGSSSALQPEQQLQLQQPQQEQRRSQWCPMLARTALIPPQALRTRAARRRRRWQQPNSNPANAAWASRNRPRSRTILHFGN